MELSSWARILILTIIYSMVNADCVVDDFAVQDNFDPAQFAGVWYQHSWILPVGLSPSDVYKDYKQTYVVDSENRINITKQYRTSAKTAETPECVEEDTAFFTVGAELKSKMIYNRDWNGDILTNDYWVISTDYTKYALTYQCKEQNVTGICVDVGATIWIRCYNQEISPTLRTQLRAKLDYLCVGSLTEDEQENICYKDSCGDTSGGPTTSAHLPTLLYALILVGPAMWNCL